MLQCVKACYGHGFDRLMSLGCSSYQVSPVTVKSPWSLPGACRCLSGQVSHLYLSWVMSTHALAVGSSSLSR